ncbi:unnamed protein product [Staurois parvus]|uniref:Uncharacterized protein n=1 Tax=Staurois parvus TaxID=386267 RepID=A0ABN9AWC6_9NEOB|nr:unnamed protein product [Staurois parvus]
MQVPVLGCTFLTLSDREEMGIGTDHQDTDDQCPDDRCPSSATPQVPPTCAQQCAH